MRWATEYSTSSLTRHYRSLLRACARHSSLHLGIQLHASATTSGLLTSPNSYLHNAILHLYSACNSPLSARKMFDQIPHSYKDTVDWTTLITCYSRTSLPLHALRLFIDMVKNNVVPDDITMVCVFNSCTKLCDHEFGVQAHGFMFKMGLASSVKASNAVMDTYVKCGLLREATMVFNDMGRGNQSVVSWTVLLEGVVKLSGLENGRKLFDQMPERNEVAWTIMIVGYVERAFTREACVLLGEMLFGLGLGLNYVTLCSVLSACSQSGDVTVGRLMHLYALKGAEDEMDIMVGTSLIDMYAKCGRIDTAFQVFKTMRRKSVVTWNAMLSGLAMHGRGSVVLDLFPKMIKEVMPDGFTFTAVLSSCSHSGLVDEGWHYFHILKTLYNISPSVEHYACMVDLLGRAGKLEEAEALIRAMPIPPNEVVLGSLLGACRVQQKLQLGEHILQELSRIYPHNTEYHILLSNMYALVGEHDKAKSLRKILKVRGIRKVPGMSSIHVSGLIYHFSAGDKSHPQSGDIYQMLDEMIRRLKLAGYVPNTASQIFVGFGSGKENEDEKEEMEHALFSHSEKLAVCFGLISTKAGAPLYVFKNLRICEDCHSAMKIISAIYNREIVIRDRNRFHCFKQGSCSCSDYW